MISIKKDCEKKIKEWGIRLLIIGFICGTFLLIPNTWIDESPPKLIFEYRNLGRNVIEEVGGTIPLIDTEKINSIEDWDYVRNLEQEIIYHDSVSVSTTGYFEGRKTPAHSGIDEKIQ